MWGKRLYNVSRFRLRIKKTNYEFYNFLIIKQTLLVVLLNTIEQS